MRKLKLTKSDLGILEELQKDGYTQDEVIGTKIHRSRPVVVRRRQQLEEAGIIRGYRADIDPKAVGLKTTVYTLVSLKQHGGGLVAEFGQVLATMPNVIEWAKIGGSWDFLLKFAVCNSEHHDALLYRLLDLPNVSRVRGMHVHGQPMTKPLPLDGGELVPPEE